MIFWKRFIGDYRSKTATLGALEVGVYDLLLDEYYATEEPIDADEMGLFRLCRAFTPAEQAAVRLVRDRFFRIGKDGKLHNDRADRQIAIERRYSKQQSAAADARWERERMRKNDLFASGSASESDRAITSSTSNIDAPASADAHADAMVPQPQLQEREETHLSGRAGRKAVNRKATPQEPPEFITWYGAYPRHEARADAAIAWSRLDPDAALIATLHTAMAWQRKYGCLRPNFADGRSTVPLPATWLNKRRWTDERPQINGNGVHKPAPDPVAVAATRLRDACSNAWGDVEAALKLKLGQVRSSDPIAGPALELSGGGLEALMAYDLHELRRHQAGFFEAYYRLAKAPKPAPVEQAVAG